MKFDNIWLSSTAALLIGMIQFFILVELFGIYMLYTPNLNPLAWMPDLGITSRWASVSVTTLWDFLLVLIASFPAAYLLAKLRPGRLWLYLVLAVIPVFLWNNQALVLRPIPIQEW